MDLIIEILRKLLLEQNNFTLTNTNPPSKQRGIFAQNYRIKTNTDRNIQKE